MNIIKFLIILLSFIISTHISFAKSYLTDYRPPRFEHFVQKILPELNKFSSENLSNLANNKSVLYPFGGPDVIYPLILFPDAETYTMIGLERTGKDAGCLSKVNPQTLDKQLESLLKRSFFITFDMSRDVTSACGVLPMLVAQLNMLGCNILNFKHSELSFGNSIEIRFSHLGKEKKLIYLKSNLENKIISEQLMQYILTNKLHDVCILKAGSYNLHKKEFTVIKDFVISKAQVILQDDTGVHIKELSKNFNIKLFGNYITPYGKSMAGYYQRELATLYKSSQPVDRVNFCYG